MKDLQRRLDNHRALTIVLIALLVMSVYINFLQYNDKKFVAEIEQMTEEYCQWQETDLGTADENY